MRTAETLASRILFWGGVLSILLMAVGLVALAVRGGLNASDPSGVFTSVAQVVRALSRWPVEPLAIVVAGVLLLLVTPFVSLVAVFVVFVIAGDRRYAGVTALLLLALLVSLAYINN